MLGKPPPTNTAFWLDRHWWCHHFMRDTLVMSWLYGFWSWSVYTNFPAVLTKNKARQVRSIFVLFWRFSWFLHVGTHFRNGLGWSPFHFLCYFRNILFDKNLFRTKWKGAAFIAVYSQSTGVLRSVQPGTDSTVCLFTVATCTRHIRKSWRKPHLWNSESNVVYTWHHK